MRLREATMLMEATAFIYDGLQPVYEVDYAGNTTNGTPLATRTHVYGRGQAVAKVDNTGTINYYLRDHLGSTRPVADSAGIIVEWMKYTPYGETLYDTAITPPPPPETKRFTGKPFDSVTGLSCFRGLPITDGVLGRQATPSPLGWRQRRHHGQSRRLGRS